MEKTGPLRYNRNEDTFKDKKGRKRNRMMINYVSQKTILVAIIVCVSLGVSCKKEEEETIVLPPISVLSVQSTWGVVTSNFLRLRERPSKQASVLAGIPRGIVVEILSKTEVPETIEKETAFWYRVNFDGLSGWVFGAYLEVCNSKKDAEDYSREMQ